MAGKTIRVLEKTLFDKFGNGMSAGGTTSVYVATNIDVSGFVYASLILRGHAFAVGTGAPSFYLSGISSAPTNEDPVATFRASGIIIDGSASKLPYGGTFPAIQIYQANLATGGGAGFMDIFLSVVQGSTANATMSFTASADLVLRS